MRSIRGVAVLLLVGGCAAAPVPAQAPAPAPAPAPPDPVTTCTLRLTYWAGETLHGTDGGYDYQEMGLNSEEYDALTAIVDAARKQGPSVVEGMVRDACGRLAARPPSSPWGY